jgi:hypothetical protein
MLVAVAAARVSKPIVFGLVENLLERYVARSASKQPLRKQA